MRSRRLRGLALTLATVAALAAPIATPSFTLAADPSATPPAQNTYVPACAESLPGFAHCDLLVPAASSSQGDVVRPAATPSGLSPADLQGAYSLPSGTNGAGMTVAIVDAFDTASAEASLATYRAQFGLPACTVANGCFRRVDQTGGTSYPIPGANTGWESETVLDLEMVSAVCPLCKIILVEANNTTMANMGIATRTAVALGANAVSNSYGIAGASEVAYDQYYNHPGVVITAATGDCGYIDHLLPCAASTPEYPASSPYVIAVGATSLTVNAHARVSETAWAGGGSGCSPAEPKPFWQTDAGCANKTSADISAVGNPVTGVSAYDPKAGGWTVYGGTSVSAPIVAAAFALKGRPAPGTYAGRRLYAGTADLYDITSGSNGSCGGSYLCTAGTGYDGPTGLGTPHGINALSPDVIAVGAGTRNSCALAANGSVSCWGFNGANQIDVIAGTYVALSTSDDHSCAIDTAGALHCWGNNTGGMAPATSAGPYKALGTGQNDTCAIDTSGGLNCWGDNTYGQASAHAGTYSAVAVGARNVCAIDTTETIVCWGDTSLGQTSSPAGTFVTITAGDNHFCALSGTGTISCWGDNGNGQAAMPSGRYLDIEAGSQGTCAISMAGFTSCWGENSHGQNSPPGTVSYRVGLGQYNGCTQTADGVGCWGLNTDGQVVPLIATSVLPAATSCTAYSADIAMSTTVVPAVSFTVVSGSLPADVTMSTTGHLSGEAAPPGTYNFTVQASNGIAPKTTAALSMTVNPGAGTPCRPRSVTAIAADASATVSWATPLDNGGSPITSYTVTSSPDSKTCTTSGLSCTVSGLTNRQQYTFTVVATNAAGPGSPSDPSGAYTPLTGATYFPVNPNRLVDSRPTYLTGVTHSLTTNVPVSFQVTDRVPGDATKNIPSNAVAITGNLTVAGNRSSGYFSLTPTKPSGTPGVSTLNFPPGDNRANGVTVLLGAGGVLWITYEGINGPADVVFDVTGYFLPNATGATYKAVNPNRLVDSRPTYLTGVAGSLTTNVPVSFQVTDRVPGDATKNIPAGAVAITGNLTVAGNLSSGYFSLTPTRPSGTPGVSTLNFPPGDNRANGVTVQLGAGGVLWVTYEGVKGPADVVFDVTGYFVPDATGATYKAVDPNRLVDSRPVYLQGVSGSLTTNVPVSFQVTGRSADATKNIPAGAVAITGNLTVAGNKSSGYFSLTPAKPSGVPGVSTLNFPPGDNRANGVTVQLGAGGVLWVTYEGVKGPADVVFDVTGYFTM